MPPQSAVPTFLMNARNVEAELNELPEFDVVLEKAANAAPMPLQAMKKAIASPARRMAVRVT